MNVARIGSDRSHDGGRRHRNCRHVESVCRWGAGGNPQGLEDPAYRRGADPVAELEQFTLDPLIPPAAVLSRKAFDQRGGLSADRGPACAGG
jgi:hypothetical protein